MIVARVRHQLFDFGRRKRSAFGTNQRMRFARECMLHIEGVHVHFEISFRANLPLDVLNRWDRAAANVVRDAAPTHRGPIDDLHRGNERARAFAADELLQRLHSIERSRRGVAGDNYMIGIDHDHIAFFVQRARRFYSAALQRLSDRQQIYSTNQNVSARFTNRQRDTGSRLRVIDKVLRRETIFCGLAIG